MKIISLYIIIGLFVFTNQRCYSQPISHYRDWSNPNYCLSVECLQEKKLTAIALFLYNLNQPLLPENMSEFESLRVIAIIDCNYPEIPNELFQCQNIVEFVYHGTLKCFDKRIFGFEKLIHLGLCANGLEQIPMSLKKLKHLESVSLCANKLKSVPRALYKLPNLKWVDLGANPIPEKEVEKFRRKRPEVVVEFESLETIKERIRRQEAELQQRQ